MEEVVVNDFLVFSVLLLASMFWLGFLLGKVYVPFAFASLEEPIYSFESGDTLEETIKKIEAVVKENAYLKKQLNEKEMFIKELESKKFYKEIK